MIDFLYKVGSRGGVTSSLYSFLRKNKDSNRKGLVEKILARDIRQYLKTDLCPTLVSHPILVPMIADIVPVYYQHGEIAAPPEAAVKGAREIFVPLEDTANNMIRNGVPESKVQLSGLCIEPEIAVNAEEYFYNRITRFRNNKQLIGAFFSSGAEPFDHIEKIISASASLDKADQKAIIFCRAEGRLEKRLSKVALAAKFNPLDDGASVPEQLRSRNVIMVSCRSRENESACTNKLFKYFDYLVAPSHERTNWAVGLGLPMFILLPTIGSFSPLNRLFLIDSKVAVDLGKASSFAELLEEIWRKGKLEEMARGGFGKYDIRGFKKIAGDLIRLLEAEA